MIRCAIDIAPLGDLSDPREIVRLAVAAEAAGWDGISIWDSLGLSMGTSAADPFVALAAVAQATIRLRLITSVIALPRRRPQLVAQAIGTLDRLSGGRSVLGVGAGGDMADFEPFGEPADAATRVARLDEALELVDRFLRGETIDHEGPGNVLRGAAVGPAPIQRPRPPIWIGGMRPGALRRAARYDGWIAIAVAEDGSGMNLTPEGLGSMVDRLRRERVDESRPYDVAVFGLTDRPLRGGSPNTPRPGPPGGSRACHPCAARSTSSWRSSTPDHRRPSTAGGAPRRRPRGEHRTFIAPASACSARRRRPPA